MEALRCEQSVFQGLHYLSTRYTWYQPSRSDRKGANKPSHKLRWRRNHGIDRKHRKQRSRLLHLALINIKIRIVLLDVAVVLRSVVIEPSEPLTNITASSQTSDPISTKLVLILSLKVHPLHQIPEQGLVPKIIQFGIDPEPRHAHISNFKTFFQEPECF